MTTDQTNRRASSAVAAIVAIIVVAVAALMVAPNLAVTSPDGAEDAATPPPSTVTATGAVTEVEVTVQGMSFIPGTIEVPAGNTLVVTLNNTGDQRHDAGDDAEDGRRRHAGDPVGDAKDDALADGDQGHARHGGADGGRNDTGNAAPTRR